MISALSDYWLQWGLVLAGMTLLFCMQWVRPRFGLAPSLLLACCAYSSIWVWATPFNRYFSVNVYDQMALKLFACDSIAKTMLIAAPLMALSENRMTFLLMGEVTASCFVFANSLLALWQARLGCDGLHCGGVIGNPSISMGLMVCMLPIFIRSFRQWPILLLAGAAVLVSKSSIALGLLAVYLCILTWQETRKYTLAPAIGTFLAIMGIGRIALGHELTNDSDRFMIWKYMLHAWSAPWNIAMGTGFGTYHVLAVNLQNGWGRHIAPGFQWETLHNDPLQMLFECGVVGLVLLCLTYLSALAKAWRERQFPIVLSILLYGMYMTLDPALHNPLPVLFGAWLFVYALRRENKEYL